jgi:hypothetical protein
MDKPPITELERNGQVEEHKTTAPPEDTDDPAFGHPAQMAEQPATHAARTSPSSYTAKNH